MINKKTFFSSSDNIHGRLKRAQMSLEESGVVMYSVGVGKKIKQNELKVGKLQINMIKLI